MNYTVVITRKYASPIPLISGDRLTAVAGSLPGAQGLPGPGARLRLVHGS